MRKKKDWWIRPEQNIHKQNETDFDSVHYGFTIPLPSMCIGLFLNIKTAFRKDDFFPSWIANRKPVSMKKVE